MADFSTASAIEPDGERRWKAHVPAGWAQGRTTFGGLQAAICARAAIEVVARSGRPDRPLRTLDVAFVAPLPAGPVEIEAEVLGEGRSASQIQVSLYSTSPDRAADRVLGARVFVVAGASRASRVRVEPRPAERPPGDPADRLPGDPADQGVELPYLAGLTPEFTQQMEYRWCSPALPFTSAGPDGALIDGWVRHRSPAEGLPALIGLLDAWPPAVLPMFAVPAPVSTVRWAIHLTGGDELAGREFAGKEWVWNEIRTLQAGDGYATTVAATYDAAGRLLAWAEQLIAIYDKPAT